MFAFSLYKFLIYRGGLGVDSPEFSYATPSADLKTDVLNEVVICVTSSVQACELSVQLLTKLREIVRSACERLASPQELTQLKNLNASSWFQMGINPIMLSDIVKSYAYGSFELQASQLQKVDLGTLDENEKVLFFVNTYNIAYMHAIIVKGLPGKNLYERTAFMRSSKYNLGGFVFSLVELEHGVLRAASSSPMLFGPFSASMAFAGMYCNQMNILNVILKVMYVLDIYRERSSKGICIEVGKTISFFLPIHSFFFFSATSSVERSFKNR